MTTISHVRGCDPHSMIDFAADIVAQNEKFVTQVDAMNSSVDKAMDKWKGDGATAASERAVAHKLHGNHLATSIVDIADHYNTYGAQLADTKTALLKILDQEIPKGMSYDDDGNVTAPKMPSDGSNAVANALAQQVLDGQASGYQTRIKALLFQFGLSEVSANTAITTDLQLLGGYETTPDGAPPSSKVQDILDGNKQLPSDPKELRDFWDSLTPAEKDALYEHDQYIGNHDGLPTADRDRYNREKLDDEITHAQAAQDTVDQLTAQHPDWAKGENLPPENEPGAIFADRTKYDAWKTQLDDAKDRAAFLPDMRKVEGEANKPGRYLMVWDSVTGDSMAHAAVSAGNPDTATNVSTYVPGTAVTPEKIGGYMDRADLMRESAKAAGARDPAVITWIGYDTPPTAVDLGAHLDPTNWNIDDASNRKYADAGAPALNKFQEGLRASHDGNPSYNTVVGHSYGTAVVGDAAAHGNTLNADAVALVASPGTTVDHASDLHLTGVPQDQVPNKVYVSTAAHDVIYEAQLAEPFGTDPQDSSFGATHFASDPGKDGPFGISTEAHGQYWDIVDGKPCKSLVNLGDIIAGVEPTAK
ncbi:hypothetical protein GFY24_39010 [Nocardia sp. SYP-A9097]|uniref:alpha/beta hydrolase n=1 Tax=Nocardia sp. SYP-A9097 TaxID=2663237 RepID=UPI00129B2494|nr:alpha/beta hydrolase [Nocardia sp. SYP-A9097]MRH93341.1 hypothetical protein [Nocardia sp. SYP-A9097]